MYNIYTMLDFVIVCSSVNIRLYLLLNVFIQNCRYNICSCQTFLTGSTLQLAKAGLVCRISESIFLNS